MKWISPSHEYDHIYDRYKGIITQSKKICVFGAGFWGRKCVEALLSHNKEVYYVVDNDSSKWGSYFKDEIKIISFEEYLQLKNVYLLVALSTKNYKEVEEQLVNYGLKEDADYCQSEIFIKILPVLTLYHENKLCLDVVELSLTERCTLRCQKCAHGCCYVSMDKEDMSLDEVKKSADNLFSLADKINEFYLIGGEPLLYKNLSEAIHYIGKRYRGKISKFIITTNGTIKPNAEVMEAVREYDLTIYISNYTKAIPSMKKKYRELCDLLDQNQINYALSEIERMWYDYGFDYVDHGFDKEKIERVHDACFTRCREIRGDKFYYCIQARSVAENTGRNVSDDDYLNLTKLHGITGKKILYEYATGFCEKGYIDMCNYCNGADSLNHMIPVAEQIEH